jgi:sodium-dependent dicarboxylate transporter 2/3/5
VALVAGWALSLIAPADWPPGEGTIVVARSGHTVIEAPVTVGAAATINLAAVVDDTSYRLELPNGIPVDSLIEATVAVASTGDATAGPADDLRIDLTLSDGRVEPIAVVGYDEDRAVMVARRQPTHSSDFALGLLGLVAVLWVTEAVPLFVTSLAIPVLLVIEGAATAQAATAPFFNPIIVLFFAGFLMAEAMARSGLDHRIAIAVTARSGAGPKTMFVSMLAIAAAMSMFMSNTAAAAVLIPIAVAVSTPLEDTRFRSMLVLGIAYAATIGGVGSAIGTPANQLAIEFLDGFGYRSITFVEWFLFGLPMVVVFLPVTGLYLWMTHRPEVDRERFVSAHRSAVEEHRAIGPPNGNQITVLLVFFGVMVGWLTQAMHGIHPGIVALAGAVVLFVIGRLEPEDLGRISWSSLLTFGGGLTLGYFLVASGTSDWIATQLDGLGAIPTWAAVAAVATLTVALTTVASNTASAAILIPLALPIAAVIGLDPVVLVVVVAIASSIDFALVVGTPPTMIAYSTGLFTAGGIFRKGVLLDLLGILILSLGIVQIWHLMGIT